MKPTPQPDDGHPLRRLLDRLRMEEEPDASLPWGILLAAGIVLILALAGLWIASSLTFGIGTPFQ